MRSGLTVIFNQFVAGGHALRHSSFAFSSDIYFSHIDIAVGSNSNSFSSFAVPYIKTPLGGFSTSIRIVTFLLRLTFLALQLWSGVRITIFPFSYLNQTGAACIVPSSLRLQNLAILASLRKARARYYWCD